MERERLDGQRKDHHLPVLHAALPGQLVHRFGRFITPACMLPAAFSVPPLQRHICAGYMGLSAQIVEVKLFMLCHERTINRKYAKKFHSAGSSFTLEKNS